MDNYMFGAAANARNFLMQPQLERERQADRAAAEEQRRRANAYQDFQMEQARLAVEAAQREALARQKQQAFEQQRQRRMASSAAGALGIPQRIANGEIVPNGGAMPTNIPGKPGYVPPVAGAAGVPAPMGGPPAPLQSGAPAMSTVPNGGTAPGMVEQIDPATGQPVGVVTVTGQGVQRVQPWEGLRQTSPKEILERQLADAWDAGDYEHFNQLNSRYWEMMTDEEKAVWQRLGTTASFILQQPREARPALVRQALQEFNIDPNQTQLDDLLGPGNELALEQALVGVMARGAPAEANKEGVRVWGTAREFRRPEVIDQGNQRTVVSMSGTNPGQPISSFDVQPDPNAVLSSQTTMRGQDLTFRLGQINAGLRQLEIERQSASDARRNEIDREKLALEREAQSLTRQWMQGSNGSQPQPGASGITWEGN